MSLSTLATPELVRAVADLSRIKEMKVAIKYSTQCGLISFAATAAGGLAAGPVGIAVGGLLGTLCASLYANGKFKSVPEVLNDEATDEQKEKLSKALLDLFSAHNIMTIAQLAAMIQSDQILIEALKKLISDFIMSDFGYTAVL